MKKLLWILVFSMGLSLAPMQQTHAQVLQVIQAAIVKAIKAMDLAVQRLQNKTIWLQNAQKALENSMSKLELDEITGWVSKHREQYANYFEELKKVKEAISGYQQVKQIMQQQEMLVSEYKNAWTLFRKDNHFTPAEIDYMTKVYSGVVDESLKNLDQLFLVINSFTLQMTDGKRLQIIHEVASHMDETLNDLRDFNRQNALLSLQRSRDEAEAARVKAMYGIQ
jgi:hypothetical protein